MEEQSKSKGGTEHSLEHHLSGFEEEKERMRAEKEELQEAAARDRLELEEQLKAEQEQQSALHARVKEMEEQARLEREAIEREKARLEVSHLVISKLRLLSFGSSTVTNCCPPTNNSPDCPPPRHMTDASPRLVSPPT